MERLTERFENGQVGVAGCGKNCKYSYKYCENAEERCPVFNEIYEKLAAYEDAEEQGQILRLPCKVGDTVYAFLSTCNYFTECQINKIELKPTLYGNTCYFLEPIGHRGCLYRCFEDEFGKTVFLTKEEAEAKLKEMSCFQNGNN